MTVKASKAVRNHMLGVENLAALFKHAKLVIYTGAAPTNADDAATGTALVSISDASGALTAEVLATGTVSVTGTTGSVTAVTVNGIDILQGTVAFNTSINQTASDLCDAINRAQTFPKYAASVSGPTVTLTAPRGSGTQPNTHVVAGTTTITLTYGNMAGGVAGVNGLKFGAPAAGVLAKLSSQVWSGLIGTSGTAGYWRLYGSVADAAAADATETFPRLQGTIATSGGDINLTSTTLTAGATQTINTFQITMPA